MPYNALYSFIETGLFTRLVTEYLSDEEYGKLQSALIENPTAGDVVSDRGACANCAGGRADEASEVATA
jgi:hypothetical protein